VDCLGRRVILPAHRATDHEGRVLVGVRPEKVHLVTGQEELPTDVNVIGPGTVADVSFAGVSTQYLVDVPGGGRLSVFSQNLGVGGDARPGDSVHLAWAPQHTFGLNGDEDTQAGLEELEAELRPAEAG